MAAEPPDNLETVHRPRIAVTAEGPASLVVVVLEGPDQGKQFSLDNLQTGPVLIGTSESCDVRLGDREVSRRHVSLEVEGGRTRITDLRSTNGTFIDGVAMLDGYLAPDQIVRIGTTAFRIAAGTSDAAPPVAAATFGRVVAASPAMQRLFPLCRRLAASDVPVIIEGETGTGKEVLAEALHEESARASGPFVVFDCTAVPTNLVEGELFGHERGSFTGAVGAHKGLFEQAHGGTLLIDEIGDFDLALQPKLLRAIERREVRRIGGTQSIKVDVRLLAATRRDLDREVQKGRFRDDLFHRIAVARVELPPLRKRKGDVERLARHFLKEMGGDPALLSSALLARWNDYGWPGNVRELRNAMARQIALGELAEDLTAAAPPEPTSAPGGDVVEAILAMRLPLTLARQRVVEDFERRYVSRVLEEHGGNVVHAARASGIARRYLQKLKARQSR